MSVSGGDILWKNNILSFQGTATGFDFFLFGITGNLGYDFLETGGSSFLSSVNSGKTPLFAGGALLSSSSSVNSVIGVQTNAGNYAAVIVTANNGVTITLQFVTFGASVPGGPKTQQSLTLTVPRNLA